MYECMYFNFILKMELSFFLSSWYSDVTLENNKSHSEANWTFCFTYFHLFIFHTCVFLSSGSWGLGGPGVWGVLGVLGVWGVLGVQGSGESWGPWGLGVLVEPLPAVTG